VDSGEQWPGLIRIKRLFPHQPASQTGQLSQGDILVAANGVPLIGLTNYVSSRVSVGFSIASLRVVVVKSAVFWDITPCSPLNRILLAT
jgi:hypothetical protein